MSQQPFDPSQDGAKMDFSEDMSYADYLRVDELLSLQVPLSNAHDEPLFIIQHQVSELWMKLLIHELVSAREALKTKEISAAIKKLARACRIFEQLTAQWDVLRTMTPADYLVFRDELGQASGLQSYQYRMLEFILGNRNPAMIEPHHHRAEVTKWLSDELQCPSIYDEVITHLLQEIYGGKVTIPSPKLNAPHQDITVVREAWAKVYNDVEAHWQLYELGEKLVDLEDYARRWRFSHVLTVERVIGYKRGTGGTSGVHYLRWMLGVELFPELWHVRGDL